MITDSYTLFSETRKTLFLLPKCGSDSAKQFVLYGSLILKKKKIRRSSFDEVNSD